VRIVDRGAEPGTDLIQVAYVESLEEEGLMLSVLRAEGIKCLSNRVNINGVRARPFHLISTPRSIYVRPEDAERARKLLSEVEVEEPLEDENPPENETRFEDQIPEPVNADHLTRAAGSRYRDHGAGPGYLGMWLVGIGVVGLAIVAFLLLHS